MSCTSYISGMFILCSHHKDNKLRSILEILNPKRYNEPIAANARFGFKHLQTVLSSYSKSAFSRHDNVWTSSALFIWLNKNVLFRSSKSAFSRQDNLRASSALFIWLNENCSFLVPRKVRFLAMTMSEQARHCSFGLTKTVLFHSLKSAFSRHGDVRANSALFIWLNENVGKHAKSNRETSR